MIHCNSNVLYVLRGNGNNSQTWETYNGLWPVQINLENNDFTSGGNVTAYSDIKIKKNIVTVDNALSKTLKLRGVYYNRIMEEDTTKVRRIGVIAQEIKEILPEVVISNIDPETKQDTLSVDYGNITALLIEAIKELKAELDEVKQKLPK
ncbi:MAG: tail fiber domain-containing protein [Betaproteobacteria bacterium]|nr:tail fiber domain-containing protein [Betaproteobacteria bacterium]